MPKTSASQRVYLLNLLREGPHQWNEWRKKNWNKTLDFSGENFSKANLATADLSWVDLINAKFRGTSLFDANLSGTDLTRADLRKADLSGANLRGADLSNANLQGADLSQANLNAADLCEANLRGANLSEANFCIADLRKADLSGAILSETIFAKNNLTKTIGLADCEHRAPSVLDFSTLIQSPHLPLGFLRGCGLPDILIEYLPSLLSQPIQFYSCFISYSSDDQSFADRLYSDLQNRGVRCWFAPHDVKGGRKLHQQIEDAIRIYDRLLLILSPSSMNSEWVKTEIAKARNREKQEKRQMLFPVGLVRFEALRDWECFDADLGKDSAREIREYYVPDFSNWKDHDSYQVEFEKLVRDLKAEKQSKPSVG